VRPKTIIVIAIEVEQVSFTLREIAKPALGAIPGDDIDFVPIDAFEGLFNYEANFAAKQGPLLSAFPGFYPTFLAVNCSPDENRIGASVGFTGCGIRTATGASKRRRMNK